MSISRIRRPSPLGEAAALSEDVLDHLWMSLGAEGRGDAAEALRHLEDYPLADSSPHVQLLRELDDLGADAPGWVWSRWALEQAYRSLFLRSDSRLREAAVLAGLTMHPDRLVEGFGETEAQELLLEVMSLDWVCRQVALYELGGLETYLDEHAGPGLLRRADRVRAWRVVRMGGFRIVSASRGEATLEDLTTGVERRVLDLGSLVTSDEECVVGRLVPMRCAPGWIFESRPLPVPGHVAAEVARVSGRPGPHAWVDVLAAAVAAGELDSSLTPVSCLTTLTSDLPPLAWIAPDLVSSDDVFEMVAGAVETAALCSGAGTELTWEPQFVTAFLVSSQVYAAAAERLTEPKHRPGWEALAPSTPDPVRSRCLALATRCRDAA